MYFMKILSFIYKNVTKKNIRTTCRYLYYIRYIKYLYRDLYYYKINFCLYTTCIYTQRNSYARFSCTTLHFVLSGFVLWVQMFFLLKQLLLLI